MTKPKTAVPAVMAGGLLGCLFFFDMRDARLPGQAKMSVFLYCFESESRIAEQVMPLSRGHEQGPPKAVATAAARARTAQWTLSSAREQESDPAPDPKTRSQVNAP